MSQDFKHNEIVEVFNDTLDKYIPARYIALDMEEGDAINWHVCYTSRDVEGLRDAEYGYNVHYNIRKMRIPVYRYLVEPGGDIDPWITQAHYKEGDADFLNGKITKIESTLEYRTMDGDYPFA